MEGKLNRRKEGIVKGSISDSQSGSSDAVPWSRDTGGEIGGGGNAMVEIEIEAAKALAGLAHPEIWNRVGGTCRRVKSGSLPQDLFSSRTAALRLALDSAEDVAIIIPHQCKNTCTISMEKEKFDHDAGLHKQIPDCRPCHGSFSSSKSRQKLTEDEKEARRIRRVLANRESARQTIRRRQALYDELDSKADSLAHENENLKREMELAVQEYDSLKTTNMRLKARMAKAMAPMLNETTIELNPTNQEMSKSSCPGGPFVIYKQSTPVQFMWPAIVQSPNAITPQDLFHEQENPRKRYGPHPPLYIIPCPFVFPFPGNGTGLQLRPSFESANGEIVVPMNDHCATSSSAMTIGFGAPQPVLVRPSSSIKQEKVAGDSVFPLTSTRTLDAMTEKKLDLSVCQSKKQVDVAVAVEARKRRKELTKLKILHRRDFRCG